VKNRASGGQGLRPCTRSIFVSLALALAALCPVRAAAAERETQWVLIKGVDVPTAVFLSWDYSEVIFRVTCDPKARELVIRLTNDREIEFTKADTISLQWGEHRRLPLKTILDESGLEARIPANSPTLAPFLRDRGQKEIDAPNGTDEPFYVGEAAELQQVALACR
jgi:hypothetical protein